MDKLLTSLIRGIESSISQTNIERQRDGVSRIEPARIVILGQFSLFAFPEISKQIPLAATLDFDALIEGDWCVRAIVKRVLAELGLVYDDLSTEIWMPPETKYRLIHQSELLSVEASEPIFTLISKAIKAPEKNEMLIRRALDIFGDKLALGIKRHGGNLAILEEQK